MTSHFWQTTRFQVDLTLPKVMGIVNITPDSFSDGGQFLQTPQALQQCEQLVRDGADILDLGAESSRPGAAPLPVDEELKRLVPVLREAVGLGVPISLDSYKPEVMQVALDLGVDILNDIWGFRQSNTRGNSTSAQTAAAHPSCGLCVMHMHGEPATMQLQPMQGDAVVQVMAFLKGRTQALIDLGVEATRIVVDPGIGFGKTVEQNFSLLREQRIMADYGFPWLVGWSRKSSLARVTGAQTPDDRVVPSVVAALLAVERGAKIVRVHDVAATVAGLKVWMK